MYKEVVPDTIRKIGTVGKAEYAAAKQRRMQICKTNEYPFYKTKQLPPRVTVNVGIPTH